MHNYKVWEHLNGETIQDAETIEEYNEEDAARSFVDSNYGDKEYFKIDGNEGVVLRTQDSDGVIADVEITWEFEPTFSAMTVT